MKTKIDIFAGFLGAGKTTLIKKMIKNANSEDRLVVLQNEHGIVEFKASEIKGTGIDLEGIHSGCICCDMAGNFIQSIESIVEWASPDRILLEPSGLSKLSDILKILRNSCSKYVEITGIATVVDACKFNLYLRNYQGFYDDQLKSTNCILLSKTEKKCSKEIEEVICQIRGLNPAVAVLASPWDELSPAYIKESMKYREVI